MHSGMGIAFSIMLPALVAIIQPVRLLISARAYQPANSVSFTTNQHQSDLSVQKPTSEQAK